MAYVEVEVDVDIGEHLGEVGVTDLIEHLNTRTLDTKNRVQLQSMLKGEYSRQLDLYTLIDEVKMEVVLRGLKDKTLEQLEKFFKY